MLCRTFCNRLSAPLWLFSNHLYIHTSAGTQKDEKLFKLRAQVAQHEISVKAKQMIDLVGKGKHITVKVLPTRRATPEDVKNKLANVKSVVQDKAKELEVEIDVKDKGGGQFNITKRMKDEAT